MFNFGRSRNSQTYQSGDNFHVLNSISEVSGAYLFSPFPNGKFEPFFLAGGGALIFSPSSTWVVFPDLPNNVPDRVQVNLGASRQTELAFLYGLGVDYKLPWLLQTFAAFAIPRLSLQSTGLQSGPERGQRSELLYRRQGTHGRAVGWVCVPLLKNLATDLRGSTPMCQEPYPAKTQRRTARDSRDFNHRGHGGSQRKCVADPKN